MSSFTGAGAAETLSSLLDLLGNTEQLKKRINDLIAAEKAEREERDKLEKTKGEVAKLEASSTKRLAEINGKVAEHERQVRVFEGERDKQNTMLAARERGLYDREQKLAQDEQQFEQYIAAKTGELKQREEQVHLGELRIEHQTAALETLTRRMENKERALQNAMATT